MVKLQNQYKKLGRLELDGKDLGELAVAFVSDMTSGGNQGPKMGPMHAFEHLRQAYRVQSHSFYERHMRLTPRQTREVLSDKTEDSVHVVAELNGKGVGFAAVEKAKFNDGEGYVNVFFKPIVYKSKKQDLSNAIVVKANGHKEPLEKLIERLSFDRINGTNLLAVSDATQEQLGILKDSGYRVLKPKFGVPDLRAETAQQYLKRTDWVYLGVKAPEALKTKYMHGLPLDKSFHLLNDYIREGYIDQSVTVRGDREFPIKRIDPARRMYYDSIRRMISTAVNHNGEVVVPYEDVDIRKLGLTPLTDREKKELTDRYVELGKKAFGEYKFYPPK